MANSMGVGRNGFWSRLSGISEPQVSSRPSTKEPQPQPKSRLTLRIRDSGDKGSTGTVLRKDRPRRGEGASGGRGRHSLGNPETIAPDVALRVLQQADIPARKRRRRAGPIPNAGRPAPNPRRRSGCRCTKDSARAHTVRSRSMRYSFRGDQRPILAILTLQLTRAGLRPAKAKTALRTTGMRLPGEIRKVPGA